MPVSTQLRRNGQALKVGGWSWWHLGRLHDAMAEENPFEDEDKVPYFPRDGVYVFKERHVFEAPETDIWRDGEPGKTFVLEILPGDEYHAWR